MRLFFLAFMFVLKAPTDAASPREGVAKGAQAPDQKSSGSRDSGATSAEPAAAAAKALAEATAKGLHGAGGALLSADAQEAYCSKAMQKYSSLLESVRILRVPEEPDPEGFPPPDPDVALNRRYKSALYWFGAGFVLQIPSPGEAEGNDGEKQYFLKAEELKASQRAWLLYRDQNARFFSALSPSVSELDWLKWLTSSRVAELDEWMSAPASAESIRKSSSDTPEVIQAIGSLRSVMAFADTQKELADQLDTRRGNVAYNEFLETEWPPLAGLLLRHLNKGQQESYHKAVEKGEALLKGKLVSIRKKADKVIDGNEGGSLASLVSNGVHIYQEHDRILRLKPFVRFMPSLLQPELVSLFQVLEKHSR